MEKKKETPSAEELLRKIQELEQRHALLRQEMSKLKRSGAAALTESQYLNIMQSMGQAMHIFDLDGRIIHWNRTAQVIYGFTPAEAFGKTPTELLVQPWDASLADALIQRTVKGESWSGEFPIKNKRGEQFIVIATNTPFRDENARLVGGICISIDARPYEATMPSPSFTLRTSIVSKISNLASKVKSKIKTAENNKDHEGEGYPKEDALQSSTGTEESITGMPRADSSDENENKPGIHKILSSKAEAWMGKKGILWPWKASERDAESFDSRIGHLGWNRLDIEEPRPQTYSSSSAEAEIVPMESTSSTANKLEASGKWFSSFNVIGPSSTSRGGTSNKSNAIIKVEDGLDYDILWEDLTIREQIGQGSCGTVYHALWHGSDVAVKIFSYQEYSDDVILSFRQEVSLMKRIRHPNILLFMGAVTSPKHRCIVTEFLPRGNLFQILRRNTTRLDWRRRVHMAMDIARGMNYLHHCNPPIIHRDLKSSNLLVDRNWTVKVGDFGLSRIKHETYLRTKSGKGTPQWMAPEILCNEQANEKSDVYSYGVILWEITTEKIPWDDLNPMQVIGAVGFMNQRLEVPKDVDPLWASLIQRCWCRTKRVKDGRIMLENMKV